MPTVHFTHNGIVDVSIDFELYCKCGRGICSNTKPRRSRGDHENVFVAHCDDCEYEKDSLETRVSELEEENQDLRTENEELSKRLKEVEE